MGMIAQSINDNHPALLPLKIRMFYVNVFIKSIRFSDFSQMRENNL